MRIDLNKNFFSRGLKYKKKVFLLFPRYIEGYIIWLEYVWKHYSWEYDKTLLLPRVVKKFNYYSRILYEKKECE